MPRKGASGQILCATRIVSPPSALHGMPMVRRSPLDDPRTAAHAWARYRRLMRMMFGLTVGVVILAMALIYHQLGPVSVHVFIATAMGIALTMLLMSALMGLMFLSSGTGHDEAVDGSLDEVAQSREGRKR
jgi:hypothetical protein